MAGSYPNAPSRRIPTDIDGTICAVASGGWPTTDYGSYSTYATEAQMDLKSNLDLVGAAGSGLSLGNSGGSVAMYIFARPMECDGYAASLDDGGAWNNALYYSTDSNNGLTGTWLSSGVSLVNPAGSRADARNYIGSLALTGVTAVRIKPSGASGGGGTIDSWHMYGEPTPGYDTDRLIFINTTTSLEYGLPLDYGDVPRGSAWDTTFKLRNNSTTLTASTVQITSVDLHISDISSSWYTYSEGGAFQSTLPLGSSIGPSSDSPTLTVRRIVPDASFLGIAEARIQVSVGSWT